MIENEIYGKVRDVVGALRSPWASLGLGCQEVSQDSITSASEDSDHGTTSLLLMMEMPSPRCQEQSQIKTLGRVDGWKGPRVARMKVPVCLLSGSSRHLFLGQGRIFLSHPSLWSQYIAPWFHFLLVAVSHFE